MDVYVIMIAYTAAGDERDHCFIMIIEEKEQNVNPELWAYHEFSPAFESNCHK